MYPRWLPSRVQVCRSKDLNLFTLSRLSAESRNTDYMNDVTRVTNKLITSRYNRRGTFWMKYESSRAWSNLTSVSTVHGLSFWTLSLPQRRSAHWRVASRRVREMTRMISMMMMTAELRRHQQLHREAKMHRFIVAITFYIKVTIGTYILR